MVIKEEDLIDTKMIWSSETWERLVKIKTNFSSYSIYQARKSIIVMKPKDYEIWSDPNCSSEEKERLLEKCDPINNI